MASLALASASVMDCSSAAMASLSPLWRALISPLRVLMSAALTAAAADTASTLPSTASISLACAFTVASIAANSPIRSLSWACSAPMSFSAPVMRVLSSATRSSVSLSRVSRSATSLSRASTSAVSATTSVSLA